MRVGRCESGAVASRRPFSALLSFSSLPYASKAASSAHKIARNLSRREVLSSFRLDNFCSDKEKPAENTCVFSRGLTQYGRKFRGENRLCPTNICPLTNPCRCGIITAEEVRKMKKTKLIISLILLLATALTFASCGARSEEHTSELQSLL